MRIALVYLEQTLQSGFSSCSLLCCKLPSENHLLCLGSLLYREGISPFVLAWNCPVLCFQSENAVLTPDIFQESCNCRDFSSKAVKSQHSLCSRSSAGQWPESHLLSYNVKWLNAITVLMIKSSSFISFHLHSVFLGTCLDGQSAGSPFRAAGAGDWQCQGAPVRRESRSVPCPGTAPPWQSSAGHSAGSWCFVQHFQSQQQRNSCSAWKWPWEFNPEPDAAICASAGIPCSHEKSW